MGWDTKLSEAQRRGDEVAIRCGQTVNPVITVGKNTYIFTTQHNICLCWVKEADASRMLDMKVGCCGSQHRRYMVATESDVRQFTYGGR